MAASTNEFSGFRPDAIQFLADLAANNERPWFQARKAEYEQLLKAPLEALCSALSERLASRGIPLASDPARSPFRIYRDIRFSKDKSPYKTNVGASFPWVGDRTAPSGATALEAQGHTGVGGYFHFQPGEIYVGGGMWHPEPSRLAAWRSLVANDPGRVHAAIEEARFVARFGSIGGDGLRRVPAGFAADHPEAHLLRLKDVTFGRRLVDAEAFSPDLPDTLADAFAAAVPVLRLLADLSV